MRVITSHLTIPQNKSQDSQDAKIVSFRKQNFDNIWHPKNTKHAKKQENISHKEENNQSIQTEPDFKLQKVFKNSYYDCVTYVQLRRDVEHRQKMRPKLQR